MLSISTARSPARNSGVRLLDSSSLSLNATTAGMTPVAASTASSAHLVFPVPGTGASNTCSGTVLNAGLATSDRIADITTEYDGDEVAIGSKFVSKSSGSTNGNSRSSG